MERVIVLGAGASKSYADSKTNVRMPVAVDFFETFRKLSIAESPWVLIGELINYIAKRDGKEILEFLNFSEDIEVLHSEIQEKLYKELNKKNFKLGPNNIQVIKAYTQLIFLFVSVINEIQNGPVSESHISLARQLTSDDTIITFNWDTLMDRALQSETSWTTDTGYFVQPVAIYRNGWTTPIIAQKKGNHPKLLKLHGSSNWITSYMQPHQGGLELMQETDYGKFYIYESTRSPYSCYKGRYMNGYEDFSYGYYPPNLPLAGKSPPEGMSLISMLPNLGFTPEGKSKDDGLVSMPLIIPPVKKKEYDSFGDVFSQLWTESKNQLNLAKQIYVIGYSFPATDVRTSELFRSAFVKRIEYPEITIVNPNPQPIYQRFAEDFGIPASKITVQNSFFTKDFRI